MTDALVITGATDTASVDYTVTVVTAPAGEGSTWAVTVTAAPQPGFQFPPNTTTTWNFSGTVDCLTPTTPAVPTVIYSCVTDTLTVVGADDTASVDYTVTVVTAPAGEGSPWAVTVTAAPQPGFEFPPNTTTTWNFSGTVNCDQPVTPTTPTAAYDCTSSTVTVTGAVDTPSIDYTVTVVTPPAGEGSTWAISVTAVPLPGFEFPPGTTATWSFSGVVDCDSGVDPPTTTSTTTTLPPGATTTTTAPSTPTTTSNESGAGATTTQPSGRLPVTGSSSSMLFSWAIVVTALGGMMVLLVRRRAPADRAPEPDLNRRPAPSSGRVDGDPESAVRRPNAGVDRLAERHPVTGASHVLASAADDHHPVDRWDRADELVTALPADLRQRPVGRQAEHPALFPLAPDHAPRIGEQGRLDHVVVRQERLEQQPAAARARAHQPGCPHDQPHRLFGGPVARCEQFTIEIEERDRVGTSDTVEHGLGADVHPGLRRPLGPGAGDLDHRPDRPPPRAPRGAA